MASQTQQQQQVGEYNNMTLIQREKHRKLLRALKRAMEAIDSASCNVPLASPLAHRVEAQWTRLDDLFDDVADGRYDANGEKQ